MADIAETFLVRVFFPLRQISKFVHKNSNTLDKALQTKALLVVFYSTTIAGHRYQFYPSIINVISLTKAARVRSKCFGRTVYTMITISSVDASLDTSYFFAGIP